jgi:hypothetical protein
MPDYESFEQCRATVRRIEKKVDGQQLLASPITINAEDLREIGAIVPDEDVVIAEEVAAQFDLLKRQITSSPWHFNQRLKAAHAAAVTNAEWYRRLSSLVELQEARPPQRIVDASWRLVAIEAVTYCLQLGDDPNRSSILSTLYDNPQVQGHLLGLGTDTNALTQVLDAVTRAQENYVFDEFAVAVVWASVQEYGELPDLQRLMEDIETRFDIDLGCGPSEEICEIATDKQKRSLKTMYQAISRNTITSFNEFVGVVGSEAEAKKHLVAVNRLLIRTLQRDFDTLDSSRPRHYCRWDGGNQRMVRDLWEGDVSLDP